MKKGFTLVEILGVIIILSAILLISVPAVARYIKESREKSYNLQIENIKKTLEDFSSSNRNLLPQIDKEVITVTLGQLKSEGLLKNQITNPKNNEIIEDSLELTIRKNGNNYIYEVDESTLETRINENKSPILTLNGSIVEYYKIGDLYIEKGAIAHDYNGTSISEIDIDSSNVDMDEAGIYKVNYETTDENGIKTYAIRNVIVR